MSWKIKSKQANKIIDLSYGKKKISGDSNWSNFGFVRISLFNFGTTIRFKRCNDPRPH